MSTTLRFASAMAMAVSALVGTSCSKDSTPPTPVASLNSVTVTPATVVSPNPAQGTVALTAPAPTGGSTVSLSSSSAAATVPASVLIGAGASSMGFTIATAGSGTSTITASMGGVTRTAQLMVNPGLTANFSVASTLKAQRKLANGTVEDIPGLGPGSADACPILAAQSSSSRSLACMFDGGASMAEGSSISQFQWTYKFATQSVTENVNNTSPPTTARLIPAARDCGFFGNGTFAPTDGGGLRFISMRVELRVLNAQNQLSDLKFSENVRIFPGGNCGYAF